MNEAQTEFEYIDPALKAAGWGEVEGSRVRKQYPITQGRIFGQNRRAQPLKADYVLPYRNRNLAVIGAKARDKYYTEGVGQAKDYAERLNISYTYSTNGLRIYRIDMVEGSEGDETAYPTPDELWEMAYPAPINTLQTDQAVWRERLFSIPFEDRSGIWQLRYYKENAIARVLEAVADGKERILLTLATGTGKTAIAFQIAWKLFHARWNLRRDGQRSPRILFLADRNILADQAFHSFGAFEEDALVRIAPDEIRKKGKVPKNGSIFFTIFQTFMTNPKQQEVLDNTAAEPRPEYGSGSSADQFNFGRYPRDFFDFIIIDECHRGGANDESSWRAIMEYFSPAVQLGLTATPKRDVNKDTYNYFGNPVYIYSLREGINDGFLTPFKVKQISTTGDSYTYTSGDTVLECEVEEGREYTREEQNRIIELMDIERFRVQTFMSEINQNQKSLVFCATQIHAAAVRDLVNQYARSTNPHYCHRVTADDGKIGEQHLRDFQDNGKSIPTVLTTSQKLSTGVDAPEIRNIVLLRSVNSMVEFKQIVGRGTRLYDGKDYFTLFDFYDAHHHFQDDAWHGEPLEPEVCKTCGQYPCVCPPKVCKICGMSPCVCEKPEPVPCPECGNYPCTCENPPRQMVRIKLSDNKVRELDKMIKTSFYDPSGKPISAEEFIRRLIGDLPSPFSSEGELRKLWSLPETRKRLLDELREKGYYQTHLEELSRLVHGEESDLSDVLNYIAYHRDLVPRIIRAERAKVYFDSYNKKQQEFLDFVLKQYVSEGFSELDDARLPDLLELKYSALADAKGLLGDIKSIRESFIGFQEHIYSVA